MTRLSSISGRTMGSHGASLPPRTGGGGDDGRNNRGSGDSMPNYGARLRRARLGLAVAMTPIFVLFISFTAVYLAQRGFFTFDMSGGTRVLSWIPVRLPWPLLIANSAILIASTVTIELARRAITQEWALAPLKSIPGISLVDENYFPWLGLTGVLGTTFLLGQLFIWHRLGERGFHLGTSPSSSFVYFVTGMHGIHLAGGALALLYAGIATLLHRPVESRRIVVDVTAWYWHSMTGIWLYILMLFSFAAQ